jgi:hypothetical protein
MRNTAENYQKLLVTAAILITAKMNFLDFFKTLLDTVWRRCNMWVLAEAKTFHFLLRNMV